MDPCRVHEAIVEPFLRDLTEGTVEIQDDPSTTTLDGGNWTLSFGRDDQVGLDLSLNEPNYFDSDPATYLENVLKLGAGESLQVLDRELEGAVVWDLTDSADIWSRRLVDRLSSQCEQSREGALRAGPVWSSDPPEKTDRIPFFGCNTG